jgi:hypothetical protein
MIGSKIHTVALSGLAGVLVPMALAGSTATAAASVGHHDRHARGAHRHHHHGIPQHNGGDRDSDNNGAPSDGDGNQ